jgi:molecular chaperone DnaJ
VSTRDYLEKDYYAALGVSKDAGTDEIKKAYRKLAVRYHPDKNPGDKDAERRFKEVSEAHAVLSDPERRKEYDEARSLFGSGAFRRGAGGGTGNGGGFTFDLGDLFGGMPGAGTGTGTGTGPAPGSGGIGDLFGNLFGGGGTGRRARPRRGNDVETSVTLEFAEAVNGVTLPLRINAPGPCEVCHGSGAKPGTFPKICPDCNGSGLVTNNQGTFSFSEPCLKCQGVGTVVDTPCPECRGTGETNRSRNITVRVPAGVRDGQRIRIAGKGAPGERGGPAGDLYVVCRVKSHPLFGRKGDDLTLLLPVTIAEAALGANVRVPTLDGSVTVKVPAGTPSGKTLRVRGRGVPRREGKPGDLLVTVDVAVPKKLTPAAKEALQQLATAVQEDPRPHITQAVIRGGEPR